MSDEIGPVQQDWVTRVPFMQQAVLFAAVRAPDGIRKNHPVKLLMRWYRRCILLAAFERRAILDPFAPGGGSFTGPFTDYHAQQYLGAQTAQKGWQHVREMYLGHVDELPHHFQLHLMHAAQIVGVHHPVPEIADWWRQFYLMIVNDAHLHPETDAEMNARLSDDRDEWRRREVVTAQDDEGKP